ncbi:hypothetical protein RJT34_00307 [Clitoria ternatea]|uniref:Uncharacterized protein n=1 Tax=Clitoria ternatea TaxID=43366 RepID=A0AAN9KIA0_CLITE
MFLIRELLNKPNHKGNSNVVRGRAAEANRLDKREKQRKKKREKKEKSSGIIDEKFLYINYTYPPNTISFFRFGNCGEKRKKKPRRGKRCETKKKEETHRRRNRRCFTGDRSSASANFRSLLLLLRVVFLEGDIICLFVFVLDCRFVPCDFTSGIFVRI